MGDFGNANRHLAMSDWSVIGESFGRIHSVMISVIIVSWVSPDDVLWTRRLLLRWEPSHYSNTLISKQHEIPLSCCDRWYWWELKPESWQTQADIEGIEIKTPRQKAKTLSILAGLEDIRQNAVQNVVHQTIYTIPYMQMGARACSGRSRWCFGRWISARSECTGSEQLPMSWVPWNCWNSACCCLTLCWTVGSAGICLCLPHESLGRWIPRFPATTSRAFLWSLASWLTVCLSMLGISVALLWPSQMCRCRLPCVRGL